MNKKIDYQHLYDSRTHEEIKDYLKLVDNTRLRVSEVLRKILIEDDIFKIVSDISIQVDPCVADLFWVIAEDDIFWFSLNFWTILRHQILGLTRSIRGFEVMLANGVWFIEHPDGTADFWKLTPEQIETKIRSSIIKRILSLEKLKS